MAKTLCLVLSLFTSLVCADGKLEFLSEAYFSSRDVQAEASEVGTCKVGSELTPFISLHIRYAFQEGLTLGLKNLFPLVRGEKGFALSEVFNREAVRVGASTDVQAPFFAVAHIAEAGMPLWRSGNLNLMPHLALVVLVGGLYLFVIFTLGLLKILK